jgi:excisionase family DNA binding protein
VVKTSKASGNKRVSAFFVTGLTLLVGILLLLSAVFIGGCAGSTPEPTPTPAPAPTPPVFGDEILTIDGTAAFLKVSRRQIYLMLKNEELPARRVGKRWRFSKAALSAYVAGRE